MKALDGNVWRRDDVQPQLQIVLGFEATEAFGDLHGNERHATIREARMRADAEHLAACNLDAGRSVIKGLTRLPCPWCKQAFRVRPSHCLAFAEGAGHAVGNRLYQILEKGSRTRLHENFDGHAGRRGKAFDPGQLFG